MGGEAVAETASMLKKKQKRRKEKTLSAKLRLKEKKNPGEKPPKEKKWEYLIH